MVYILLISSIVAEVFGTTFMKLSEGFTKHRYTIGMIIGYILAFYLVSLVMLEMSLGVTYAIWSGAGTVLTAIIGVLLFSEKINKMGMIGIAMLCAGLILINVV